MMLQKSTTSFWTLNSIDYTFCPKSFVPSTLHAADKRFQTKPISKCSYFCMQKTYKSHINICIHRNLLYILHVVNLFISFEVYLEIRRHFSTPLHISQFF